MVVTRSFKSVPVSTTAFELHELVSEKNGIGRLSKKKKEKKEGKIIIYDKGEAIDDIIDDAERGDLDL